MVDVTDDATIQVTVEKAGTRTGTYSEAGNAVTLAATDTNTEAQLTARRDGDNLLLDFPSTYKLEPDYTYILSAVIKPTEASYRKYRDQDETYPETPDGNTGTHATNGEDGLYSNDQANVNYTYDGVSGQRAAYAHPVVRLNPGKLIITKNITGLSAGEIDTLDLSFDLTITYPNDNDSTSDDAETRHITLSQMTKSTDGSYSYTITGLSPGTQYTITEAGAALDGYKVTTTVNGVKSVDASGTIAEGSTATVNYVNAYVKSITSVKVEKQVTGNMGDWEKRFSFTASLSGESSSMAGLTYVSYTKGEDGKLTAGAETKITTDTFNFHLKDDEYYIFYRVPMGANLTIRETPDDYILTKVEATNLNGKELTRSGSSVTLPVSTLATDSNCGHTVTFTNDRTVVIATGISLDSLPYLLILAGVAAAGIFLFLRKPRDYED